MQNVISDNPLSIVELVMQSSLMAKGVLLLLLVFSIVSWTIIFNKLSTYRSAKSEDIKFLDTFSKTENLTHIYNFAKELRASPLARVFLTGYRELYVFQEMAKGHIDHLFQQILLSLFYLIGVAQYVWFSCLYFAPLSSLPLVCY